MTEHFKVTYTYNNREYVLGYYRDKDAVRFGVSVALPKGAKLGEITKVML